MNILLKSALFFLAIQSQLASAETIREIIASRPDLSIFQELLERHDRNNLEYESFRNNPLSPWVPLYDSLGDVFEVAHPEYRGGVSTENEIYTSSNPGPRDVELIPGRLGVTYFIPPDVAFSKMSDGQLETLRKFPEVLMEYLFRHEYESVAATVEALASPKLRISADAYIFGAVGYDVTKSENSFIYRGAKISEKNIKISDGLYNLLAEPIEFPFDSFYQASRLTFLRSDKSFSTLLSLLDLTGLTETIESLDDTKVLMAPNNAAFALLGPEVTNALTREPGLVTLKKVLFNHVAFQKTGARIRNYFELFTLDQEPRLSRGARGDIRGRTGLKTLAGSSYLPLNAQMEPLGVREVGAMANNDASITFKILRIVPSNRGLTTEVNRVIIPGSN